MKIMSGIGVSIRLTAKIQTENSTPIMIIQNKKAKGKRTTMRGSSPESNRCLGRFDASV